MLIILKGEFMLYIQKKKSKKKTNIKSVKNIDCYDFMKKKSLTNVKMVAGWKMLNGCER
jgi:hypothetical protein